MLKTLFQSSKGSVYKTQDIQEYYPFDGKPLMVLINEPIWDMLREHCLYMTLAITNKCNMRCSVCIMYDKQGRAPFQELSQEDVRYVMRKLGRRKKKIVIFGGEPTLRDDLFEIIRIIKDSGNIPTLYTNGIKLADPDYVKKLSSSGLKKIFLSIDSLTEKGTEVLQGDKKFLKLKLKALDNLKQYSKIKFWLSSMIAYGVNHEEISSLIQKVIEDKSGMLKGIYLLAATNTGMSWYQLDANTVLTIDYILNKIEEATDGVLSIEYFKEFTRLKSNLNNVLKRFRARFPYSPDRALVKKLKDGSIKPVIDPNDIKSINRLIENGNYFALSKYLIKYNNWIGLLARVFQPEIVEFEAFHKSEVVFIDPSYMTVTPIHSLLSRGMTNVIKDEQGFQLYAQGPS